MALFCSIQAVSLVTSISYRQWIRAGRHHAVIELRRGRSRTSRRSRFRLGRVPCTFIHAAVVADHRLERPHMRSHRPLKHKKLDKQRTGSTALSTAHTSAMSHWHRHSVVTAHCCCVEMGLAPRWTWNKSSCGERDSPLWHYVAAAQSCCLALACSWCSTQSVVVCRSSMNSSKDSCVHRSGQLWVWINRWQEDTIHGSHHVW